MSNNRLAGKGAPTRMTKGVVGQHYEDLNTGNIYECLVASEQSKLNGAIGGGYVWKLKYTGEDRRDHEAIFGAGNSVEMVEQVLVNVKQIELEERVTGFAMGAIPCTHKFVAGQTYNVEFNGDSFTCVAKDISENGMTSTILGNAGMLPGGENNFEDTGEEFLFGMIEEMSLMQCIIQLPVAHAAYFTHKFDIKISTMVEKSSMVEKVLLDQSVEFRESQDLEGMYTAGPNPVAFQFIPGQAYKVEIEGESFDVIGKEFITEGQTVTLIGNLHYAGIGDDTGEPFVVQTFTLNGTTAMMMAIAAPATYDMVDTVSFHVKITTMEEKRESGNVVGFYIDADGNWRCTETYADAKKLIFENNAPVVVVRVSEESSRFSSSAVFVEVTDEGSEFECMWIFAYNGSTLKASQNFYPDGGFESMAD